MKLITTKDYLLLIDEEAKIKINDFITDKYNVWQWKDDSSLLGRKKIMAYYPLTSEAKELTGILLLPPYKENEYILSKKSFKYVSESGFGSASYAAHVMQGYVDGYKANIKQFTLEDMQKAVLFGINSIKDSKELYRQDMTKEEVAAYYVKSLSIQEFPKEFIPELTQKCSCPCHQPGNMMLHIMACCRPGSLITKHVNGKLELVGQYKY